MAPDKPVALHSGQANLEDFIGHIAQDRGLKLHICHVNNPADVQLIQKAKKQGLDVTSGVCPHHLELNEDDIQRLKWYARMQPPLVRAVDTEQLMSQFITGEIDILETDHAPHSLRAKVAAARAEKAFDAAKNRNDSSEEEVAKLEKEAVREACYGVPGLEFGLKFALRDVTLGKLSLRRFIEATSTIPAAIIGSKVSPKTLVTWQMVEFEINKDDILSKCGWSPYLGKIVVGKVLASRIKGWPLIENGQHTASYPKVSYYLREK